MSETPQHAHRTGSRSGAVSGRRQAASARDWRKAMSDHVAYALLVYTGLQIFMTVKALNEGGSGLLPYAALVILVIGLWLAKKIKALFTDVATKRELEPTLIGFF
ncbi:MAG: hypothetical protein GVX90_05645, partial [Alphaproteobacteria bacterium]|nr:hypothetical protein [Alphaproteobacteria bacterium]